MAVPVTAVPLASQPANVTPAGAASLSRISVVSVATAAYSRVAPRCSALVWALGSKLLQLAERKNQSVRSEVAEACVEMQWLAERKYGV